MLEIANKWGWATSDKLSIVNIDYSLVRGIKANPKSEFRLNSSAMKEIYALAGPLIDEHKNECIGYHIKRYDSNNTPGKKGETKQIILNRLRNGNPIKSTDLLKDTNVRIDVILGHLNDLERKGLITKQRQGKRYIWSIKNAN
jgi:predicted transcriptional regulator